MPQDYSSQRKAWIHIDEYEKEHIKFKQWKKDENKTDLLSCELAAEESIKEVTFHFHTLRAHHFFVKPHGDFLKDLKEKLKENELIILLHFAQNYSFIVQDAVQGYHWKWHFTLSLSTIKKVVSFAQKAIV